MRIVCPSCHAAYDVPDQVVARRRKLRCARCAADFTGAGSEPAVQPRPAPVQTPEAPRVLAAEPPPAAIMDTAKQPAPDKPPAASQPGPAWWQGWSAATWRAPITRAWPASARVYAALRYAK